MNVFNELRKSKKFWVAVAGVLVTGFGGKLGIGPEQVDWIAGIFMTLLGGYAAQDFGKAAKQ